MKNNKITNDTLRSAQRRATLSLLQSGIPLDNLNSIVIDYVPELLMLAMCQSCQVAVQLDPDMKEESLAHYRSHLLSR